MEPINVTWDEVRKARKRKCYLDDGRCPVTDEDATELVNQRGFLLLGVIPKRDLPNLSSSAHPQEWNISSLAWQWKETLPAVKACVYLKWFYNQGTFISWEMYPAFYALWGMRLEPEEAYEAGLFNRSEMDVLHIVTEEGPINSRELWRKLRNRFETRSVLLSILARLQRSFLITVSGGETSGWSMHCWDLVSRQIPENLLVCLPKRELAMQKIVMQAAETIPFCTPREVAGLFRWSPSLVLETAKAMEEQGYLRLDTHIERHQDPCLIPVKSTPDFSIL